MVDPKNIKIVFTDIDGTLYSHVTKRVPPSASRAIKELQKKGIKVFLCSGRNYYLIRKSGVLNECKPDGLVTMNGSNAIIENTIIYRKPIPSEVVDKMVMLAKRLKFGLTLIEENGTIDEMQEMGKRKLAYEINYIPDGYYVLVKFTSAPDFPAELDRILGITDGVIRSLITLREE